MTGSRALVAALMGLLLAAGVALAVAVWPREGAPASQPGQAQGSQGPTRLLGPTARRRRVDVSLTLRLPREAALRAFLAAQSDPASPSYGTTIDPEEFGERFGLSQGRLDSLRAQLAGHGLRVVGSYPQRTSLRIQGTAAAIAAAFGTKLVDRADARGRRFRVPQRTPTLPRWLRGDVTGVTGLDTRPVLEPHAIRPGGLAPTDLITAYNHKPLRDAGIRGEGQTVAILSFDSFVESDVKAFEDKFDIDGPAVEKVPVAGGAVPGEGQDEVNLDIDTIRGIAPGAKVLDFEGTNGRVGFAEMVNAVVADGRAKTISISWGRCDLRVPPPVRDADEAAFAAAAAAGITAFAASGDEGAYDCQSHDLEDQRLSVDWPSAGGNIVAVGGTRLSVRTDGTYLEEFGWENVLSGTGGGGGLASVTTRPAWQRGVKGVENADSNGKRQIPDVAGPADPASGVNVISQGKFNPSVGGTSAAAPFWAATVAVARNYAAERGARVPGFLPPLLYRVAARFPEAFNDVVKGGNRRYNAGPGWDYATGLGSPNADRFARALASLLGRP